MRILFLSLAMGILPMLAYAIFLWWLDHWEREPLPLIAGAFAWGAIPSVILATAVQIGLVLLARVTVDPDAATLAVVSITVWAPITEELAKGIALLLIFLFLSHELDSLLDGIIYGGVVGFGFGAVENVFYFIGHGMAQPDVLGGLIFLRAFVFGLMHAIFTSFTGLGFAMARFARRPSRGVFWVLLGLVLAMLSHGLHNTLLTVGGGLPGAILAFGAYGIGIVWVLLVIGYSLRRQGRWLRHYLAEEVELGTLTRRQAEAACSFRTRLSYGFALLGMRVGTGREPRRFAVLCAKLAFKKHRLATLGEGRADGGPVEGLRRQVAEAGRRLVGTT